MSEEENNQDQNSELEQKDTFSAKCPSCGAEMVYAPDIKKLKCPFCDTTKDIDLTKYAEEIDFAMLLKNNNEWAKDTCVYQCKNCGVKEVVSRKSIATKCSFCGTPNVVLTDELSGLKPNAVVPFQITKSVAIENVKTWGKKKILAPKAFKQSITPEDTAGIYNPAFTFDSDTMSPYRGQLGKYYTTTRIVNGKTITETKIKYFNISGNYKCRFDDILIEASDNINQQSINAMSPFNTNSSQKYNESFLLGFSANQYTKEGDVCWKEARQFIDKTVREKILLQYTYDVVASLYINTSCSNITYKYILLPIYVGHCTYKNKNYNFFVNGKNGKVTGKTPLSALRVSVLVLLILAFLALIIYLVYMFMVD